jgi:hypothetical protein
MCGACRNRNVAHVVNSADRWDPVLMASSASGCSIERRVSGGRLGRKKLANIARYSTVFRFAQALLSMTNKNPFVVFLLVFVTLGIYAVVWYVKAGREMRRRGADVPTAWLMIIPIVSIYWFIKWCAGVGKVGAMNGFLAALLLIFLGPLGMAIVQSQFNNVK